MESLRFGLIPSDGATFPVRKDVIQDRGSEIREEWLCILVTPCTFIANNRDYVCQG